MTSFDEAVDWLYTQLPMYQRIGAAAYKADLNNTIKLCDHFNNPQNGFKSIHVAGTNGKGSTSHMLAAILQKSGYKVGLYTSPHLKSFTERIRINGVEIDQKFVVDFVRNNKIFFSSFDPSFFEITVAMAFVYFQEEKVDVAVIETGLGGRLDSTNIITPILSIITNIGMDHQQLLGDTLEKIAFEKAGIIKQKVPVVIGEYQEQVSKVFEQRAHELNAPIHFADKIWTTNYIGESSAKNKLYQVFNYKSTTDHFELKTDQLGIYQEHNCKTVLASISLLQALGLDQITKESILVGFEKVTILTGLKGRWQIISLNPIIVADTGHNVHGIAYILAQLAKQPAKTLRMVIGFVNDKSISEVLQMLPKNAIYYFTQAAIPRAKPAAEIYQDALRMGLNGTVYDTTLAALQQAKQDADPDDFIFIGGSTFIVAELI